MGWRPFYSRSDKALALEAMNSMNVLTLKRKCYRELSGGQQQRVLLARALCADKKLLVLDEPVSGLDPDASQDMYSLVASLNHRGLTVIMITHDVEAAMNYSSHILRLSGGRAFFGTKEDFLRNA